MQIEETPQAKNKVRTPPSERIRETVLAYQCPNCFTTGWVKCEGSIVCSCGSEFFVSETEGLLPRWPIFGKSDSGSA